MRDVDIRVGFIGGKSSGVSSYHGRPLMGCVFVKRRGQAEGSSDCQQRFIRD
jgi:hypothetical protein